MTSEGCFWRTEEAQETRTVISRLLIFAHFEVSRLLIQSEVVSFSLLIFTYLYSKSLTRK